MVPWIGVQLHPKRTSGFCNQMYTLATSARVAHEARVPFLFVSSFLLEIETDLTRPISRILNLEATNAELRRNKFNVSLVDASNYTLVIHSVGNVLPEPVTGALTLPPNAFAADTGEVEIKLSIDGIAATWSVKKPHLSGVHLDPFSSLSYVARYDDKKDLVFAELLRSLVFQSDLVSPAVSWTAATLPPEVQVIHVRLEADAVKHWSKEAGQTEAEFKHRVENGYIRLIQLHVRKLLPVLVISGEYNNRVMTFLHDTGYNVFTPPKYAPERELAALADMAAASAIRSPMLFLCAFESSFSLTLQSRMMARKLVVLHLMSPQSGEEVYG